jgi:hypothetical protein
VIGDKEQESKKPPAGCYGILADDLFDGDQCEASFLVLSHDPGGLAPGMPYEDLSRL